MQHVFGKVFVCTNDDAAKMVCGGLFDFLKFHIFLSLPFSPSPTPSLYQKKKKKERERMKEKENAKGH